MRPPRTTEDKIKELDKRAACVRSTQAHVQDEESVSDGARYGCGGSGLIWKIFRWIAKVSRVRRVGTGDSSTLAGRVFGNQVAENRQASGTQNATSKLEAAASTMRARLAQLDERYAAARSATQAAVNATPQNKALAMRELKRSKAINVQIASTQSALDAVEQQADMLEQTAMSREVAHALGATAKSMKRDKTMLSKAEDSIDAAVEMRDLHDDLSQVMAGFGDAINNDYDEDDLVAELQGMAELNRGSIEIGNEGLAERAQSELERKHAEYDHLESLRQKLPEAPKGKMSDTESDSLLAQ